MRDVGDNMADPRAAFEHSRMGRIDPWSQQASEIARMQGGENWGNIRQGIAEYRTGQGAGPKGSDFPGYDFKTDEDKLLMAWLIESMMQGQPSGDLGITKKTKVTNRDPDFPEGLPSTAGGGYI